MDRLLAESAALVSIPLPQEEDRYDKAAKALVTKLSKLSPLELAPAKDDLDATPPSSHTILYTYILVAGIEASAASGKAPPRQLPSTALPEGALWPYITQLLFEFDPIQTRYCGIQFMRIVDCVALGAEQTANYVPAIQLLHHVILRLDNTSSTLTSTHRAFLRLCLLSQAYAEAVHILDRPIYHIPSRHDTRTNRCLCSDSDQTWTFLSPGTGLSQPITSRTYLEYYLMGGMCYMALRRYKDAMFFLEVVLTAPTLQNIASAIMVEAYKKWLFVGLLLTGTTPPIPKSVGSNAIRHIRALARPYESVAEAFKGSNIGQLRAEIEAGNHIWQDDGNYGLAVEVYQAFRKFAVQKLSRTFAALSIAEVAKRTSPDPPNIAETKAYIETLIVGGDLSAVITDGESGAQTLRFLPTSASTRPEAQVESALASLTRELQTLLKHVQDTEHRMEVTKEYIDYLKKLKKARDETKSGGKGSNKATVDEDIDEDMMEEI
ncbi:uncharacterized protein Z519_09609 [Cladophialophora bantiana CBS 173.52]|uniref:COP9 signalosome complex subunit 3 N-terminal helical repeats domain-containing protein n=1 Tax=Cladophialophora bantiana (strain ATCC 10958 / CBS 173.52 / CDC B-1940 / NIH 8579) TaxID=1442370 RepID=A0A0D2H840_CLAB1|nr:uncharacterized protein Z519_09609 [Cladophialophora bantiana CBS 173.52]KIW89453.1 hypothetical protein Z519_09609 [Cladophialophora bantiana CBS 173.52]